MKASLRAIAYIIVGLAGGAFIAIPRGCAQSAPVTEPGGTAEATATAISDPAEYAWQLFLFINHPAKTGIAGVADETKPFGVIDPGASVVWETWAMASGQKDSEVYRPDGSRPAKWTDLERGERLLVLDRNLEQAAVLGESRQIRPRFFPSAPLDQKVRQNRSTYEFITDNEMYHRGGLEALLAKAELTDNRSMITFTDMSKEVKAQWYPIKEADKSRYFWRQVKNADGTPKVYGLVSLHVITKDLPNWFWADFGHVDCETQKSACDPTSLKEVFGDRFRPGGSQDRTS